MANIRAADSGSSAARAATRRSPLRKLYVQVLIAIAVGNLLQPGAGLHINPAQLDEKAVAGYVTSAKSLTIVDFLMKMIPSNLVGAVAQGDLLPVLVMSVLFGFALIHMGERGARLVGLMDDFM